MCKLQMTICFFARWIVTTYKDYLAKDSDREQNIDLTLDLHPEWSLADVCKRLGQSQEEAQPILTRRSAAKMAAGAIVVNEGGARLL